MASSLSGLYSAFKLQNPTPNKSPLARVDSASFPARSKLLDRFSVQSVAKEIPANLSKPKNETLKEEIKKGLEKDPRELWRRYVDWLYQHRELGLYLDVSRVGFTDEFVAEMEPRFQAAFRAMEKLEKGAIANPDEGRMVGHYWLRNSGLAPSKYLRSQIEATFDAVCSFAADVVCGKVSFFPWIAFRREVVLFCGMGC